MLESLFHSDNPALALLQLAQRLVIVLIALTVHEVAHGFAAYKLGDDTAAKYGRLSLNPLKHLDPWGFISMLLFGFGWANPVPIRAGRFKNPRLGMAISALAGPLSNIILAVFGWLVLEAVIFFMPESLYLAYAGYTAVSADMTFAVNLLTAATTFLWTFSYLNVSLAVFNFLPVPPLDGSRVLYSFLPDKIYFGVMKYERAISIVIMVMLLVGLLDYPLSWLAGTIMSGIDFIIPLI